MKNPDSDSKKRVVDDPDSFFKHLADAGDDLIYRYELAPERGFSYVSRSALKFTGYSREEHFADPDLGYKLVHPDDRHLLEEAVAGGENSRIVLRWIKKDGTVVWTEQLNVIVYDDSGTPVAIEGIARDDTERREALERLAHSYDLMRYIIEHTNSAVAVHDRELRYIYVSQRYLDAYKIKDRNIIGKHHYEVFPDLPQKWRDVHQEALKGKITRSDRDNYPKADGSVEWTRWECRPWYEADGSVGGVIIYTEVITEWVEAEAKLRNSEEQYRLLVENQNDLIVKIDQDGRFLFVSPSYCRMFGKSERELLGSNFMPFVHRDDRESTAEAMKDLTRPPHTAYVEQRVAGTEGLVWVAWIDTAILDDEGNIKEILGVGRDITDRKMAEIELQRKNDELERFNRVMVDRENRMIGLKKEVNVLLAELNRPKKYRSPDDVIEADR